MLTGACVIVKGCVGQMLSRVLARILKLPVIFTRVQVQIGLKCFKIVIFCHQKWKLPIKITGIWSRS